MLQSPVNDHCADGDGDAANSLLTFCRWLRLEELCVRGCAELRRVCILRCGALARNIKVDFCRSFEIANKTAVPGAAAPACECAFPQRRAVVALRLVLVWGRLGGRLRGKNAFVSAKLLKIGASGGAAQAAEANRAHYRFFHWTVSAHVAAPFGIQSPVRDSTSCGCGLWYFTRLRTLN